MIAIVLILLPTPVLAQESDAPYRDWFSLTAHLRAHGIEPVRVDWRTITPMCLGLKTARDETPYNRCRFEKALDQHVFTGDRAACERQARASAPEGLRRERVTQVFDTGSRYTEIRYSPPRRSDLRLIRQGEYAACMQGLGWIDTNDWRAGRR